MNISADPFSISSFGSLMSSVFARLSAELTDNNRPLRLRLPIKDKLLNDALLIQRIIGHDALCAGLDLDVHCLSGSAHIPLKTLIALPIALEIVTDRGELHAIHGIITEASAGESDGGFATYRLRVQDAFSLLTRRRNTRVFINKSVLDISYILLDEWKSRSPLFAAILQVNSSRITQDYPTIAFTMQSGEDDRAFLFRLWKRWGISWFFEATHDKNNTIQHHLCLFDDSSRLSQNNAGTIKFQRQSATERRDTITQFQGHRTLVSGSSQYHQWQPNTAQLQISSQYNHHDQGERAKNLGATLDDAILDTPATGLDDSTADRFGLLHIQQHEQLSKCFHGQGNVRDLQVGQWIAISGHPEIDTHPDNERQFVITELWIDAENNLPKPVADRIKTLNISNGWSKQTNPHRYSNRFRAIRRDIPIVPIFNPQADLPQVHAMIGVVVCPQGEEVHCDAWGRIQIRFPNTQAEDHSHSGGAGSNDSEGDSAWIDLMSSWAGDQYGAIQLPRAGDAVIIQFFNGDPDRPYIAGRMYHSQRQPPTFSNTGNLPDNRYLSGIKSKEINGSQYNQLRFDDTPNQISAQVASQHGESQLNLGYLTHPRTGGKGDPRGEGLEIRTDDSGSIRAGKGLLLTTHSQSNAQGLQMDASPAQSSLNNNLEQMKSLSEAAQNQHANPLTSIDQLKSCIDALEAKVDGFKQALLILSSPNDIALTTPSNIHSHAGQHQTQSATGSIHQAAGKDYSLVTGKGISLFTADQGTKIFTAKGKVEIQAQSDNLEAIAAKTIKIISTQDGIEISASQSITLTAGGSRIKISQSGIEIISPSAIQYKGAQHVFGGGARVSTTLPFLPSAAITDFSQLVNFTFKTTATTEDQMVLKLEKSFFVVDANSQRMIYMQKLGEGDKASSNRFYTDQTQLVTTYLYFNDFANISYKASSQDDYDCELEYGDDEDSDESKSHGDSV
jgi:type VI secretion system secreted protein VgrG